MSVILYRRLTQTVAAVVVALSATTVVAQLESKSGMDGTNFQGTVRYENNTPAQFVQVEYGQTAKVAGEPLRKPIGWESSELAPCMMIQYKIEAPGYQPVWGRVDMSLNPCRALEWITLRAKPQTGNPGDKTPPAGVIDSWIAAIPPEAKTEFDAGQSALNGNDLSGAIPHLQKAISIYPRFAEAYQLVGVAQLQTNQGPQAESSLLKAIEIDDKLPQAQYLLGVLYAKTNRADKAEGPLNRFAELAPQNPDAQFELAKVTFALAMFPEAAVHARSAIKLKEPNAGVYIVLGYALLRQKKAQDAKHAFRQFLQLDSSSPMAADVKDVIAQIDQRSGLESRTR